MSNQQLLKKYCLENHSLPHWKGSKTWKMIQKKAENKIVTYIPRQQKDSCRNKIHNFNVTPSVQYSGTNRNSQQWCRRFKSSGMLWLLVVWVAVVLKDHCAFTFRAKKSRSNCAGKSGCIIQVRMSKAVETSLGWYSKTLQILRKRCVN